MNTRLQATQYIWTTFAIAMAILFITTIFTPGGLGVGHVILGVFISGAVFVSTGTVWNWGSVGEGEMTSEVKSTSKRKRLDAMLDEMDEADVQALRERLMLDEDAQRYGLSDDGELVQRRR
jgi:hypothetical protein